jgi:Co/Zn/Cd efflux system component
MWATMRCARIGCRHRNSASEAVGRLHAPQPVDGWILIAVAGVGIVVNTATALRFMRGRDTCTSAAHSCT